MSLSTQTGHSRRALLLALALLPAATGCDTPAAQYTGPSTDLPEVVIQPADVILSVGQRARLFATILAPGATGFAVEWTSTDPAVATVAADGTVEALAAGEATVIAVAGDARGLAIVAVKAAGPGRPDRPGLK
jgi:hypothetical protein